MLSSFKKVSFLRQAMQLIFLEVSLNLGHLIADQAANILCFFFREKVPVQMHVPIPVVQSRCTDPCCAQGLCAGAGTLLSSRLSTQPARGAAQGAAGRRVGGRSPPAGQGPSAATAAAWGMGLLPLQMPSCEQAPHPPLPPSTASASKALGPGHELLHCSHCSS